MTAVQARIDVRPTILTILSMVESNDGEVQRKEDYLSGSVDVAGFASILGAAFLWAASPDGPFHGVCRVLVNQSMDFQKSDRLNTSMVTVPVNASSIAATCRHRDGFSAVSGRWSRWPSTP